LLGSELPSPWPRCAVRRSNYAPFHVKQGGRESADAVNEARSPRAVRLTGNRKVDRCDWRIKRATHVRPLPGRPTRTSAARSVAQRDPVAPVSSNETRAGPGAGLQWAFAGRGRTFGAGVCGSRPGTTPPAGFLARARQSTGPACRMVGSRARRYSPFHVKRDGPQGRFRAGQDIRTGAGDPTASPLQHGHRAGAAGEVPPERREAGCSADVDRERVRARAHDVGRSRYGEPSQTPLDAVLRVRRGRGGRTET
jgi:hypothetical protein